MRCMGPFDHTLETTEGSVRTSIDYMRWRIVEIVVSAGFTHQLRIARFVS